MLFIGVSSFNGILEIRPDCAVPARMIFAFHPRTPLAPRSTTAGLLWMTRVIDSNCGSLKKPVPIWGELLDERTGKRLLAAASPLVDCMAGKLGRALVGILEKLEPALLGAIEPENDSLTEFGRLALMLETHAPLEIPEIRRDRLPDCLPSRF